MGRDLQGFHKAPSERLAQGFQIGESYIKAEARGFFITSHATTFCPLLQAMFFLS